MVKCVLCAKRTAAGKGSFFQVPRSAEARLAWSRACCMKFTGKERICADHFRPVDIIALGGKKYLYPTAIPYFRATQNTISKFTPIMLENIKNVKLEPEIEISNAYSFKMNDSQFSSQPKQSSTFAENTTTPARDCETQTDFIVMESLMQGEISELKKEIKKLRQENKELSFNLEKANAILNNLKKIFTEGQVRKLIFPNRNVMWGWKDISSAICLHAAGPRAYKHLYDKGFPLPHVSSLHRWYRQCDISEGILTASIESVQNMSQLCNDDKYCVLAFDEMKVIEACEYDQKGDYSRKPANNVQVVMARGLRKSWKKPVFFDFDCQMTKDVLYSIIMTLQKAGFPVVAVVCDTSPNNRKLWKDLNITVDKPWFANPADENSKVFAFVDAPHLLKMVRNYFLDTGFLWNGNLLTTKTISDLLKHTSKPDAMISSKVNDEHISVKGKGRQNVKLAAQLFSNTTASAIRECYELGLEIYKSTDTAEFIKLINDWFDVLNSTTGTFCLPGKEPFGKALPSQLGVLTRVNELMSLPIIPNKNGLEHFQKGILMTNRALVMLYEYMKTKSNTEYILTNRLNQDVLEHFFGAIRSEGGVNEHPTPKEFKYRLRKYILARNNESSEDRGSIADDDTNVFSSAETQTLQKSQQSRCSVVDSSLCREETTAVDGPVAHCEQNMEIEPDIIEALNFSQPDDCGVLPEDPLEYNSNYIIPELIFFTSPGHT